MLKIVSKVVNLYFDFSEMENEYYNFYFQYGLSIFFGIYGVSVSLYFPFTPYRFRLMTDANFEDGFLGKKFYAKTHYITLDLNLMASLSFLLFVVKKHLDFAVYDIDYRSDF